MRSFALVALLTAAFSLPIGGCAAIRRAPLTYPEAPAKPFARARQLDLPALLSACGKPVSDGNIERALAEFNACGGDIKVRRNQIVSALIMASDSNCTLYVQQIRGSQASLKTGLGLTSDILTAAVPVVNPKRSSDILAAVASASGTTAKTIDRNVFGDLGVSVITSTIETERAKLRTGIEGRFGDDLAKWPVELAIADALRYHARCSLAYVLPAAQAKAAQ